MTNLGTMIIGNSASWNRLVVTNGGVARFPQVSFAATWIPGNSNSVVVTGAGSVLTNSPPSAGTVWNFDFGGGDGNNITVADGGTIDYSNGGFPCRIGIGGSRNWLLVTGTGSLCRLNSTAGFTVGSASGGNVNGIIVTNGGTLTSPNATIGSAGATDNYLTVAQGGVVSNIGTLTIHPTNTVNLFGGSLTVTTLAMQPEAQIGVDLVNTGALVVTGNATLEGYVHPTNLPGSGVAMATVLTCAGALSGNLNLAPLPIPYIGSITTNLTAVPKQVNLTVQDLQAGTLFLLR